MILFLSNFKYKLSNFDSFTSGKLDINSFEPGACERKPCALSRLTIRPQTKWFSINEDFHTFKYSWLSKSWVRNDLTDSWSSLAGFVNYCITAQKSTAYTIIYNHIHSYLPRLLSSVGKSSWYTIQDVLSTWIWSILFLFFLLTHVRPTTVLTTINSTTATVLLLLHSCTTTLACLNNRMSHHRHHLFNDNNNNNEYSKTSLRDDIRSSNYINDHSEWKNIYEII